MKIKVLTDRVGPYQKGDEIEIYPHRSRVATEQTYKSLFVMVENGEAELIDDSKPVKKKTAKKAAAATARKPKTTKKK